MSPHRSIAGAALLFALSCAGGDPTQPIRSVEQAIDAPGLSPLPTLLNDSSSIWDGDAVELLVADAWATCSFTPSNSGAGDPLVPKDSYLERIKQLMDGASCLGIPPVDAATWLLQRNEKQCNIDPSTGVHAALALAPHTIPEMVSCTVGDCQSQNGSWDNAASYAGKDIQAAASNLCIAQQLRQRVPGSAGAEALLLSAAQQRHLLEITRQRAQLAALQYAAIGVVISNPSSVPSIAAPTAEQRLPVLKLFGKNANHLQDLERMGDDFAAAVQLFVVVTQEEAELVGRSASAREPRGRHAATDAEDIWGPGSWRQRLLAVLYGGDGFAIESDGSSPWKHTLDTKTPAVTFGGWPALEWPSAQEMPFFEADVQAPQAERLRQLARGFDVLDLRVTAALPGPNDPPPANDGCVDVEHAATADRLYRAVEAALRKQKCIDDAKTQQAIAACFALPNAGQTQACLDTLNQGPPACQAFTVDAVVAPTPATMQDFLLWTVHGVQPEHADQLATVLAETVTPLCVPTKPTTGDYQPGAKHLVGKMTQVTSSPPHRVRIGPTAQFASHDLADVAGRFTRYAHYRAPSFLYWEAHASDQGFPLVDWQYPTSHSQESKRLMGAISALTAVRDMMLTSMPGGITTSDPAHAFFARYPDIANVIAGAIGDSSFALRFEVEPYLDHGNPTYLEIKQTFGMAVLDADIVVPEADPWWDDAQANRYELLVIDDDLWAATLARSPGTSFVDWDIDHVVNNAQSFPFTAVENDDGAGGMRVPLERWHAPVAIAVPSFVEYHGLTFIVRKPVDSGYEYRVVASKIGTSLGQFDLWGFKNKGDYIATGGTLGRYAQSVLAQQRSNPSRPAFDGFGLPAQWVPPTNPALFGGTQGVSADVHYLEQAKEAAGQATSAVKEAFNGLLEQQTNEAAATAADAKAGQVLSQIDQQLCGAAGADCDTSQAHQNLAVAGLLDWSADVWPFVQNGLNGQAPVCDSSGTTPVLPNEAPSALEAKKAKLGFACIVLKSASGASVDAMVASAVYESLPIKPGEPPFDPDAASSAAPGFQKYSGGKLQSAFIEQWSAIAELQARVVELDDSRRAVGSVVEGVSSQQASVLAKINEIRDTFNKICKEEGGEGGAFGLASDNFYEDCPSASAGYAAAITQLELSLNQAEAEFAHSVSEAFVTLHQGANLVREAVARVQKSSAAIDELVLAARLAREQAALEAELQKKTQTTGFGLYRAYHSYDIWRAKALLENARRYAAVARRAIESRYVVDLSTMHAPEPFVASPSSWADEVYAYDLNMPAAVGLSVGPNSDTGIYPSKLTDYVNNLQSFVNGYPVGRPVSSQTQDADVITLAGPEALAGTGASPQGGKLLQWLFWCPAGNTGHWVALPSSGQSMQACGSLAPPPTRARVSFTLDAWGRADFASVEPPFADRFNTRWKAIAVNLVGTAIKECELAADPLACYAAPFVPYDLRHVGPASITNYEQDWRVLSIPPGRIEGGKALAAEQWLDPVANSWAKPYVASITHEELAERPFGGTYELEIAVGPEVQLDRIERVQILTSSTYWVKQQ